MDTLLVGTHDGPFHADDVMAYAILCRALGEIKLIRTRDERALSECDVLIDVGGEYDPFIGRFDHHMTNPPRRPCGAHYSSAGLVWHQYGIQVVANVIKDMVSHPSRVKDLVDMEIIEHIDAYDNGVYTSGYPFSSAIASYVPLSSTTEGVNNAFFEAGIMCGKVLENIIQRHAFLLRQEKAIKSADSKNCRGVMVLEDPFFSPQMVSLFDLKSKAVVFPSQGRKKWTARLFKKKKSRTWIKYPNSWLGKKGQDLVAASGIEGADYCHPKGFLAVARTKEAALAMAETAISLGKTIPSGTH